jgi:endonuclease III
MNQMESFLDLLESVYQDHPMADVTEGDPFLVLIGCIISLRTKDEVTIPACQRLFPQARTPKEMLALPVEKLEALIYPAGFYRNKARTIHSCCEELLARYEGQVPDTVEALLTLKGVGRKTANLVVGLGHQLPAICVDIHVHRISNRCGYVTTKTPDDTEFALREKLPVPYWGKINKLMVLHGREICRPIGPLCRECPVESLCDKVEVTPRKGKGKKPENRKETQRASLPF